MVISYDQALSYVICSSCLDSGDRQTDKASGVNQMILNPFLCRFRLLQDILRYTDYTTLCISFFVSLTLCFVLSYYTLVFFSLLSFFFHPTGDMPLAHPGSAEGFFLSKASFSFPLLLPGRCLILEASLNYSIKRLEVTCCDLALCKSI